MHHLVRVLAIGAVVAFASFGREARAELILGGLQTQSGQTSKSYTSPVQGIAQSFSYGSNFTLTGLDINLFFTSTSFSVSGTYTVSLYSGGLTGTSTNLGEGSWGSFGGTNSSNVVSLSGLNQSLLANTQYWIGVNTSRLGSQRNWSLFDNQFGNGTSYTATATLSSGSWTTSTGSSTNAMGLKIYGIVPEPSTYAMALAGLACGGWQMWRRRRLRQAPTLAA